MANKKARSTRVDKNMAWMIIGLTLVLALLLAAVLILGRLPGGQEKPNPGQSTTAPKETAPAQSVPEETVPQSTIQVTEQIPGNYEQWLAAAMVMGVSLEYPDFSELELYAASDTELAAKAESQGVYLRFISGGETVLLHGTPLAQERTEAGTRDIYSMQAGFSALTEVDAASVDLSSMEVYTMDSLADYIQQSLLVSVYAH